MGQGSRRIAQGGSTIALATVMLVACGGRTPYFSGSVECGNAVQETGEQCDGDDLGGVTCETLGYSGGSLTCTPTCTLITAGCWVGGSCGDGLLGFGEECDCGFDPVNLPVGCTDVNGGTWGNCDLSCQWVDNCGDGIVQLGEECDCGTHPGDLPAGCEGVNGDDSSSPFCSVGCTWDDSECTGLGNWEECDPLVPDQCCPDDWGVQLECSPLPTAAGGSVCIRHCVTTAECYWHQYCLGPQIGDLCWYAVCGQGSGLGDSMNDYCQVPDGGTGWCWPLMGREAPQDEQWGLCLEPGGIPHGEPCNPQNSFDGTDRSEPLCDYGFCRGGGGLEGVCTQFCDWEAAYAVAVYGAAPTTELLPCPGGANCFGDSGIDPTTGVRSGDLGYCLPTAEADPAYGLTTCSLITNQLISNPAQTCEDAGFIDGRCMMVAHADGSHTNGSLVGVCADNPAPTAGVWESCDPNTDTCALGTVCIETRVFAPTPTGQTRCVPLCDTAYHDGVQATCQDLGAPASSGGTPVCTSYSWLFPPNGPNDAYPSRLGLCAMPPG